MSKLRNVADDSSARALFVLCAIVFFTAVLGGSSRTNLPGLIVLRPLLVVALVALLALPGSRNWSGVRTPAILLGLFAIAMVLQLVPLPLSWWLEAAGHARYAMGAAASHASALPISLVPDLTVNSLLSLMPAACVIAAYATMRPEHRWASGWLVTAVAAASAAVALLQLGGGGHLYGPYGDAASGLLANRNHQAVLLAATLPLLAVQARWALYRPRGGLWAGVLAGLAIVLLPMILVTGSRQGLLLAAAALPAAALLAPRPRLRSRVLGKRTGWVVASSAVLLVAVLVLVAIGTDRAVSIDRIVRLDMVAHDARLRNLPTVLAMTRDFFPVGIGYGAFDPVYRGFEPDALLHASYFNHAHNDLLEIVLTGGLPAVLLVVALLGYLIWRGAGMFTRDAERSAAAGLLDRVGLAVTSLFLVASLVDYPLRAPIISVVVTLALCWVSAPPVLPCQSSSRGHAGRRSARRQS